MNIRSSSQSGIVLPITLLVLTVILLVSIAIMRSTDTSIFAVANMSLRQRAEAPVNQAIEAVIKAITDARKAAAPGVAPTMPEWFQVNQSTTNSDGIPLSLLQNRALLAADAKLYSVTVDGITLSALAEQMCVAMTGFDDPLRAQKCVTGRAESGAITSIEHNVRTVGTSARANTAEPVYRITVRADGEQNTTVFAQTFLRFQ